MINVSFDIWRWLFGVDVFNSLIRFRVSIFVGPVCVEIERKKKRYLEGQADRRRHLS